MHSERQRLRQTGRQTDKDADKELVDKQAHTQTDRIGEGVDVFGQDVRWW